jgi:hypothetical protein
MRAIGVVFLVRINMDLEELKDRLTADLDKAAMSSMTLLNGFCFLDDEASKIMPIFRNTRYIPFYYHLGKYVQPKTFLHAGMGLGLESGVFLMSCHSVEHLLVFQDPMKEHYLPRLGIRNVKNKYKKRDFDSFVGDFDADELRNKINEREWDLVIITEFMNYDRHRKYFDVLWQKTSYDGLMVVEHLSHEPNKQAFNDFIKLVNRKPVILDTRYGTGIIKK